MSNGWFNEKYRYRVNFTFVNDEGKRVRTYLNNNDEGFTLQDALDVQRELNMQGNTDVTIIQLGRK